MLDLLCSCSENFAAIEHLGLISLVSGGLYVLVLLCAIYLQYAMFDANARCSYAHVASGAQAPDPLAEGPGLWGGPSSAAWGEERRGSYEAVWRHQRAG